MLVILRTYTLGSWQAISTWIAATGSTLREAQEKSGLPRGCHRVKTCVKIVWTTSVHVFSKEDFSVAVQKFKLSLDGWYI